MDEQELRGIVRDEAARIRAREALGGEASVGSAPAAAAPPDEKGLLRSLAEHPAGRLVFGFLLTGVIGQWLSWTYAERKEEEELRRSALQAVREFSTLEQRRRAHFVSTRAAILQGRPIEIVESRKADYDGAALEWRAQLQAQKLRFREFYGYARRHPIEAAIDIDFEPVWRMLDNCLTDAAFTARDEANAKARVLAERSSKIWPASARTAEPGPWTPTYPKAAAVLRECGAKRLGEIVGKDGSQFLHSVANNCAYEISSSLNHTIMQGQHCGKPIWRQTGQRIYAALSDICDPKRAAQTEPSDDEDWGYRTPRKSAQRRWPFAISDEERGNANEARAKTIARLDRTYDQRCVRDDPWYEDALAPPE